MDQKPFIYPDGRMAPEDASKYIGLSVKRLGQLRCDGNGPLFVKVGGRIFYYKEDVDTWINSGGRLSSTSQNNFLSNVLNSKKGQ